MQKLRKITSVLLAALMLSSCFGLVFAGAEVVNPEESIDWNYGHLPQIYVQGFESKWVYFKDDPDHNSLLFPVDTDRLLGNFMNYSKYADEALAKKDPRLVYNIVYGALWDSFGPTALKPDGVTMQDEVTVDPDVLNFSRSDGEYTFKYDARLDPVDIAHTLHEYIGWVKQHSGQTKFELVGSSYGTSVVVAYLYLYGWEEFDSVVLCVPSLEGVNFVGELFSGSFNFDPDAVEAFVSGMIADETIQLLLDVMNELGMLDVLLALVVEPVLNVAVMNALEDIIHDIFATHPAMWAFVEDKYFYDALENIYGEDWNEDTEEYHQLIDKVIYYHENIKTKDREIIQEAVDSGLHFNVISKYNKAPFPFSEDGNFTGDGFVDLENASLGATVAMNGETLPEDYTQAKFPEKNYMSPDRVIDASTCLLPENTWFIKDLAHGEKPDYYYQVINRILYEDLNVFTSETLPQFVVNTGDAIVPLAEEEKEPEMNLFEKLIALFKNLFNMLIEAVKGMFA